MNLSLPIYVDTNRYYLPLTEIISQINGRISTKNEMTSIEVNNCKINLNTQENYFISDSVKFTLKKKAIVSGNVVYVSLFDLHKMLNLKIAWDEEKNSIGLFWNREKLADAKQSEGGKTALIRFEDITAAQRYATPESLEKLRIIFDYCCSRNIPMHLGWVPRFIDPKSNIDNDPAEQYSMHNANFVYTLDYFTDKNGLIGLHGYTHQSGDNESIRGSEFNGRYNASEKSVRERLEKAISDAKKLQLPIAFFESPHYAATPTPLGYVNGKQDAGNMIYKIKALKKDILGSFFFHPSIEFEYMTIQKDAKGYPSYTYSDQSALHRIINTFLEEGYTFNTISAFY